MKERVEGVEISKTESAAADASLPFETWVEKHHPDPFFLAFARGANGWAQGREMTEAAFLAALESAKGGKMFASMPPKGHYTRLVGDDGQEITVRRGRHADGSPRNELTGVGKHELVTPPPEK